MPVDSQHPSYEAALAKWCRMRHVLGGEDAVKAAGAEYLPMLSEQGELEYRGYKARAQFLNATGRALMGLQGFIFRKDPTTEVPDMLAGFASDATLTGLSWYDFVKSCVREVLGIGRAGTLVDWDEVERRPYLVAYTAEEIHNWRVERRGGQAELTLLVLFESDNVYADLQALAANLGVTPGDPASSPNAGLPNTGEAVTRRLEEPDEYAHEVYEQWRVYKLIEAGDAPYVVCEVWRKLNPEKQGDQPKWVLLKQRIPTRRGVPLDRIPFVFHSPHDSQPEVCAPPLEDMAIVNLSLYRTSADLENGRHFCGVPTPYALGFDVNKTLRVGTTTAWVCDNENAKVGYLEFTGSGLETLEKAVAEKKGEMAALGARMLEPEAKKAEAFDTVAVRAAAETASLATATVAMTQSLSRVLQIVAWWVGTVAAPEELTESVKIELNTEFTTTSLPADQITALVNAYLAGALDFESYHWKLQMGEVFKPGETAEEVLARIQAAGPPGMPEPAPEPDPNAPPPAPGPGGPPKKKKAAGGGGAK